MDEAPKAPEADNSKLMAALAYIGPLVIVSYIVAKDNPFVKFHIKQGLVLLVIEVALWFLGGMLWAFLPLLGIVNLALFVLAVIGIMNAVNKKEQELPLIGTLAKHFNF
ncbi:hypothetical protein K2X83_00485 [Patescibacteria group bacterium]|nr:hypothetical protein [Patescibacteria group bacterium]